MESKEFYVYIYLDSRKSGQWVYDDLKFNFQPLYVGKGTRNRINHHLRKKDLQKKSLKSNILNKIIKKGLKPIRYKIYEKLTNDEARSIEMKIIAHFGRINIKTGCLANLTDGGEGVTGIVVSQKTREKLRESRKKRGNQKISNSFEVDQYSQNGELLKTWGYMGEIVHSLGYSQGALSAAIYDPFHKSAYGFIWRKSSLRDEAPPVREVSKNKKVYQYSLDGYFIRSFESLKSVKLELGMRVGACVLGRQRHCGGYKWTSEYKGEIYRN